MALKETLTQKAGPLPVYGWILLISGAIGIVWYWKAKHGSSSSTDTSSTDTSQDNTSGVSPEDYAAGIIGADYDLANQLGETGAIIATNTGVTQTNTAAVSANTQAESSENAKKYAVVDYGGAVYEIGRGGGMHLNSKEYSAVGSHSQSVKNPVVEFDGTVYSLANSTDPNEGDKPGGPFHLSPSQYALWRKRHHNSYATVVAPNANVNVAPGKVI